MSRLAQFLRGVPKFLQSVPGRFSGWWATYRAWPWQRQAAVAGGGVAGVVLIVVVVIAAFGGSDPEPVAIATTTTTTSTSSTTTTTSTSSTTTTTVPEPASPLNGLPPEDPALLERRVMAVKIDNHPNARPQSGIEHADLVYELLVEGGLSRFIALFHDNDSDYVGPIRSGRVTDPTLIRPFNGVMVYSGAQPWIQNIIVSTGVSLVGEGPGTFRIESRFAPHNLYGDTEVLRQVADDRGYQDAPPGPFFAIGEFAGTEAAAEINVTWDLTNRVLWRWDGEQYIRFTNELPHMVIDEEGTETQLTTDVLVVLTGELYTATPPGEGSAVPATETTGTGTAFVFAGGLVQEGTWTRSEVSDPFMLVDGVGQLMMVPAGRPWVSIFPNSQPVTWLAEIPVP